MRTGAPGRTATVRLHIICSSPTLSQTRTNIRKVIVVTAGFGFICTPPDSLYLLNPAAAMAPVSPVLIMRVNYLQEYPNMGDSSFFVGYCAVFSKGLDKSGKK